MVQVGNSMILDTSTRDGATWHREIINGVEIDVIKEGCNITSGYPTGGLDMIPPGGFAKPK